nr:MAG TPA: hypothetical protein [Caudoviricetes sp.]
MPPIAFSTPCLAWLEAFFTSFRDLVTLSIPLAELPPSLPIPFRSFLTLLILSTAYWTLALICIFKVSSVIVLCFPPQISY